MKVKFLGTSAGWPLPRLGCSCNICTSPDPKDTRTRTQILINDEALLDAGPDTYNHLMKLDSSPAKPGQNDRGGSITHKLKAVLISHAHPDHILGLWDLPHIYGREENSLDKIQLFITKPVLRGIREVFHRDFGPIKPIIVEENQTFTIGSAKVTYIPVIHGITPAYAIKFKDGKIFTYITDFNRLPSSQKMIRHSHVLALDGSSLGKLGQGPGHISIQDGIQIAKNLKAQSTYFIHIGHKTATHNFLVNYLRQNAGPNFHIAYDNLEINL